MNDALIPTGTLTGVTPRDPVLEPSATVELVAELEERVAAAEAQAAAAQAAATAADSAKVRYAVYDTVYGRYLGGVLDKRPTKAELARLIKDDASATDDTTDLEIREV